MNNNNSIYDEFFVIHQSNNFINSIDLFINVRYRRWWNNGAEYSMFKKLEHQEKYIFE
jgi:hypothetical protein